MRAFHLTCWNCDCVVDGENHGFFDFHCDWAFCVWNPCNLGGFQPYSQKVRKEHYYSPPPVVHG